MMVSQRTSDIENAIVLLDMLITFIARYDIYGEGCQAEIKRRIADRMRYTCRDEAMIDQFLAQIEQMED